VDEGEGGRGDVLGVGAEPPRDTLGEVGLARAEVAIEREHVAGAEVGGEAFAEGEGLLGRGGFGREEGVERGLGGRAHGSSQPRGRSVTTGSSISYMLTPPC